MMRASVALLADTLGGYAGAVKIEILHIGDCQNWEEAEHRVRLALERLGRTDVEVRRVLLSSPEDAGRVWFAGSPTILVDGVDAFPTEGRTTDLACRIYRTDHGFAGVPSVDQLVGVFRRSG